MKYVLAVSGGVDSVVLLDMVATNDDGFRMRHFSGAKWPDDFIVAHFDHGMRGAASARDAKFVERLAQQYGVLFVLGKGKLGKGTSEEVAREKRYNFLSGVGGIVVTAHHRDDLLETIVMNLIRGTGWRGLAPMSNREILRPLLPFSKFEIINYALRKNLSWVEDDTNFQPNYFRNRVRDFLARMTDDDKEKLVKLYEKQKDLRDKIEREVIEILSYCHPELVSASSEKNDWILKQVQDDKCVLPRYFLIMIDDQSAFEFLHHITDGELTQPQLRQLLLFAKTAGSEKHLRIANLDIIATKRHIIFRKTF